MFVRQTEMTQVYSMSYNTCVLCHLRQAKVEKFVSLAGLSLRNSIHGMLEKLFKSIVQLNQTPTIVVIEETF